MGMMVMMMMMMMVMMMMMMMMMMMQLFLLAWQTIFWLFGCCGWLILGHAGSLIGVNVHVRCFRCFCPRPRQLGHYFFRTTRTTGN